MASNEPLWHPEAILDAEGAREWYSERSPLAARGFLLSLEHAVQAVIEAPESPPAYEHGCRRYVFPNRYPFVLVYRVGPPLQIVAVAHQRRRPGFWKDR